MEISLTDAETMRRGFAWNQLRSFGFIARGNGEPDVFVHITALSGSGTLLAEGQRVSFDIGTNPATAG